MLYRIAEIFYSLQGEGFWSGRPAIFIRLALCNLGCEFCDTDFAEREQLTDDGIISRVNSLSNRNDMVVLTGGEPTMHDLWPLCDILKRYNRFIAIETNGTQMDRIPLSVDWITVSPKVKVDYESLRGDEIKVVLDGIINPKRFLDPSRFQFDHYFIQPMSGNFPPAIKYVRENKPWRLSVQTQKFLGIS